MSQSLQSEQQTFSSVTCDNSRCLRARTTLLQESLRTAMHHTSTSELLPMQVKHALSTSAAVSLHAGNKHARSSSWRRDKVLRVSQLALPAVLLVPDSCVWFWNNFRTSERPIHRPEQQTSPYSWCVLSRLWCKNE